MDEDITIAQIDFIFFRLQENQSFLAVNHFIVKFMSAGITIKNEKIIVILDFLCDEKLAEKIPTADNEFEYRITVKGLLFNGYKNQSIKDGLNESRIKSNMEWMMIGTIAASLFALLLLFWQIFVYLYPVHKDYPLFWFQK